MSELERIDRLPPAVGVERVPAPRNGAAHYGKRTAR
jgi:hypothetical protein